MWPATTRTPRVLSRPNALRGRPSGRAYVGDRMKVHLRVRELGGSTLRLLMLRPGTKVTLATNRHHGAWHVVGDPRTARAL